MLTTWQLSPDELDLVDRVDAHGVLVARMKMGTMMSFPHLGKHGDEIPKNLEISAKANLLQVRERARHAPIGFG